METPNRIVINHIKDYFGIPDQKHIDWFTDVAAITSAILITGITCELLHGKFEAMASKIHGESYNHIKRHRLGIRGKAIFIEIAFAALAIISVFFIGIVLFVTITIQLLIRHDFSKWWMLNWCYKPLKRHYKQTFGFARLKSSPNKNVLRKI